MVKWVQVKVNPQAVTGGTPNLIFLTPPEKPRKTVKSLAGNPQMDLKEKQCRLLIKSYQRYTHTEKTLDTMRGGVEPVMKSIKEYGFKIPMVISADGEIVCGHTRYKAAEKMGLETVPCVVADDLTEDQIKAFRIADNKTSDFSLWDNKLLLED